VGWGLDTEKEKEHKGNMLKETGIGVFVVNFLWTATNGLAAIENGKACVVDINCDKREYISQIIEPSSKATLPVIGKVTTGVRAERELAGPQIIYPSS